MPPSPACISRRGIRDIKLEDPMSFGLKLAALVCLLAPLAVACGSSDETSAHRHSASRARAASCEDLTLLLRADAIARVRETARQLRTSEYWGHGRGGFDDFNG